MSVRRRNINRKPKANEKQSQDCAGIEAGRTQESLHHEDLQADTRHPAQESCLPVALALEILAREYEDSVQGEALCRAALSLAEESGVLNKYRARWDAEANDKSSRQSLLLFDRRQSLELILYYENKGKQEALNKEKAKLRQLEGRLLIGGSAQARITEEDLEAMERYIKENGF